MQDSLSRTSEDARNGRLSGWVALAIYVVSIVAANYLTHTFGMVPFGFGLVVTAGTYAAGVTLLARDFVHKRFGAGVVFAGIAVGVVLSWLLASPALAIASAVAFCVAELVDLGVFVGIRPRGFVKAAFWSGVVAAPVDTVLFLWIAGFPLTFEAILGQFIGKVLWATAVPLIVYVVVRRAVLRESVDSEGA